MPPNDKIENMKKAIIKSGFPLEIFTASILKSKEYKIVQHQYYNDAIDNKFREIDLIAEMKKEIASHEEDTKFIFQNILIIECKKQEEDSPWLFFEGDIKNKDFSTQLYTSTKKFIDKKWVADNIFPKTHYYNKIPCIYYIAPFKLTKNGDKNKGKDYIYETIFQLYSALNASIKIYTELQNKIVHKRIFFYYPIIVLDGELYSSKIKGIDTIEINPINRIQLLLNFQRETHSIKWGGKRKIRKDEKFMIDVVKKEYFSNFLDSIVLHGEIPGKRQKLKKVVQKVSKS